MNILLQYFQCTTVLPMSQCCGLPSFLLLCTCVWRALSRCGKNSLWYTNQICNTRLDDSDSMMRRRLDAVETDMLLVLWLPDPVSAKKGTRRRPGSGVFHTDVGDLVSRVERLQQTNSKHLPRRRQHPCNGNHVRKTWVLNISHSNNLFNVQRSGWRSVITKRPETFVYPEKTGPR